MRRAMVVLGCLLVAGPVVAAEEGRVECCVNAAVTGVVETARCLRLQLTTTARRAKKARRICRAIGGSLPPKTGDCACR